MPNAIQNGVQTTISLALTSGGMSIVVPTITGPSGVIAFSAGSPVPITFGAGATGEITLATATVGSGPYTLSLSTRGAESSTARSWSIGSVCLIGDLTAGTLNSALSIPPLQQVTDAGATTTDTIGLGGAIFTGGGTATITSDGDGGLNFTDEGGKILNWNFWDLQGLSIFGAALCMNNASGTGGSTLFLDGGTIQAGSGAYLVDDVNGGWIFGAGGDTITIDAGTLMVNASLQAGNGSFSNLAISSGDLNYDYADSNFSNRVISVSGANSGSISNLYVTSQIQGPSSFEVDGSGNISGNSFFGPTVSVSAGFYVNNGSNFIVIDNNSNATFNSISASGSSMPQSGGNYNIDSGGTATFANFSGSSSGTNTGDQDLSGLAANTLAIATTAPLAGGGNLTANRTLSIATANATQAGAVSSADWSSFNALVPIATANTTATVTFNTNGKSEIVYDTSGSTITSLAINLPSTSTVGQVLRYVTAGAATLVTVSGTVSVGAALTTLAANSSVAWEALTVGGSFARIQ